MPDPIAAWNDALFRAVFRSSGGETLPVQRITVSDAFLSQVAESAALDSEHGGREAFLAAIKAAYPRGEGLFSENRYEVDRWKRTGEGIPPFFANLYVSLLAASASAETSGDDDYRHRYAILLNQEVSRNLVQGHALPRLWRLLEEWTESAAARSRGWRPLRLPPRETLGRETIIGYSKQLAFPRYDDLERLAALMAQEDLGPDSPVAEILRAVGGMRSSFSERFRHEFDRFREFQRTRPEQANQTLFWEVFSEISWAPEGMSPKHGVSTVGLCVQLTDPRRPRIGLLLRDVDRLPLAKHSEWRVHPADGVPGRLQVVSAPDGVGVLENARHPWASLISQRIRKQISEGCLCFVETEGPLWVFSQTLPVGRASWLLASDARGRTIDVCLARSGCDDVACYPIDKLPGWMTIGPLVLTSAERVRLVEDLPSSVLALSVFREGPQPTGIFLRGAIRQHDGLLMLRSSPPAFLAPGAGGVSISAPDREPLPVPGTGDSLFAMPPSMIEGLPLPGDYVVEARASAGIQATRGFYFIATCTAPDPQGPDNLDDWLTEGRAGQVEVADGRRSPAVADKRSDLLPPTIGVGGGPTAPHRVDWLRLDEALSFGWQDLLEFLLAMGALRNGMSWGRLTAAVQSALDVDSWSASLLALSAEENGLVNRLHRRRWRATSFFTVPPRAYLVSTEQTAELRITGVLGRLRRRQLTANVDRLGGSVDVAIANANVVGAIRVSGLSPSAASELVRDLRIPSRPGPAETLITPDEVLGSMAIVVHEGGDTDYWDVVRHRFVDTAPEGVRLERRHFSNGPDVFVLADEKGRPIWSTHSRRWGCLVGAAVGGNLSFRLAPDGGLRASFVLPRAFSEYVLLRGGGVVAPAAPSSNGDRFVYAGTSPASWERFLAAWTTFGGTGTESATRKRAWHRALEASYPPASRLRRQPR